MLKKSLLVLIVLLSLGLGWAQGLETFVNLPATGTAYSDGTFTGQDGSTWTYTQCRGDYEITGKALMLGRNRTPQSEAYSGTIAGGIGTLSFDYSQAFTTAVNMNVLVNDVVVGNVTATGQQGAILNSGVITVNVSGPFVLKFKNVNNSDGQVVIDNVTWTGYAAGTPALVVTNNMLPFNTFVGVPSASQSYHLMAVALTNEVSVATSAPFQIRLPAGTWGTTLDLPANFNGNIEVRYNPVSQGNHTVNITHISFDENFNPVQQTFNVSGTANLATPAIVVTGTLVNFSTEVGTPSASQSYTLEGQFLTSNINVVAPNHYELSTNNVSFSPSLSLAASYNGPVYVRMTGSTLGAYAGNITHNSTGATEAIVAVTGSVNEPSAPMIVTEENFAYTVGSLLSANGWTAHSGVGTNSVSVNSENLSYPLYPPAAGLSARLVATGEDVHRTFSPLTDGDVYAAFLVKLESAQTVGDYFFHLAPDPIGSAFRARVFAKRDASGNIAFGISKATTTVAYSDFVYALNTTYLIVVKYSIVPGESNDTVHMWVNPAIGASEPTPMFTATDAGSDIAVGSMALRQGTATNAPVLLLDGIRVTNDWNKLWFTATTGQINVSGDFEAFLAIAGSPSDSQNYLLSGTNLSSNITITAPAGFQVSLTGSEPWVSVLSVAPTFNGLIHVRMNAASVGLHSGFITHTSTGAQIVSLAVNGETYPPAGEIIVNANITPFVSTTNTPSAAQSYSLSGTDLTGDIYISTAAPFQIRVLGSGTWQSTLQLAPSFNGQIEVRLLSANAGSFNGSIIHESAETSNVLISLSGSVSAGISNISALRAMPTGTTVYTLTGEAILTFQQSFRNQKFIQDATAAILIDDFSGIITTAYQVGDGITGISGTLGLFGGMLQFVPTANPAPASSSGNVIIPQAISLSELVNNFEAYESELVKVLGVNFVESGTFANGIMYNITDGTASFPFRTTFYDVDYIGTEIPATTKDIVGIPNSRVTEANLFTARKLADFSDPAPAIPTTLSFGTIGPDPIYPNTAFSVNIIAKDANGIARNVNADTIVNLSRASGNGTLSGTISGVIANGTNSVTISGVLYSIAEEGVSLTATATSGMALSAATSALFNVVSLPTTPSVAVLARPAQIDISEATSQSAVLMQVQSYPTDDIRYRLYNGSNQYYPWNGTQFVSSTSYTSGPQPIGTPSTSATWWIVFERGNNNSTIATYRDRQGPAYTANYQTLVLPEASAMTDPFNINMSLPINSGVYDLNQKYVVLGYDAVVGGNLISACSSTPVNGSFSLRASDGTTIRRLEVRALDNTLMESLTGEWDGEDDYYTSVEGLTGAALRSGLRTLTTTGHINNSWDNTRYHMYSTLDNVNNSVTCRYTNQVYPHPAGGAYTPTGLSAEHTYPREWFTTHPDYDLMNTDLHALFPVNDNANSARSNFPYDYITTITVTGGNPSIWGSGNYVSFGGTNAAARTAFEVADQFKGDAARALFYMGMRYYSDDANFTQNLVNQVPVLLQWHYSDPVDAYEIARNNGIYAFQGNRNPFVDNPEWIGDIWGTINIATPVATAASNAAEHGFTANWNAVTGAASYRLDIATNTAFTSFVSNYKNKVVSGTSYSVSGLAPNTVYYYRLRAIGNTGEISLSSNAITVSTTSGGSVAYYWNFNANVPASGLNWDQPIPSTIGSGSISYNLTKAVSFTGSLVNGESGEVTGGSFVPQGGETVVENNGNYMELSVPSTGLQNLVLTYATQRTSMGFTTHEIQYAADGVNFVSWGNVTDIATSFATKTVDLSSISVINNNPNLKLRIVFFGATNITGNNRIDNLKIFATATGGGAPDTPANLTITQSGGNIHLSWDSVTGASAYRVYTSNNPYEFTGTGYLTSGTSISFPASAVPTFFRVSAEN